MGGKLEYSRAVVCILYLVLGISFNFETRPIFNTGYSILDTSLMYPFSLAQAVNFLSEESLRLTVAGENPASGADPISRDLYSPISSLFIFSKMFFSFTFHSALENVTFSAQLNKFFLSMTYFLILTLKPL